MKKSDGIIKKIGRGLLLGIMTLSFSLPLFACGHKENKNPVVDPTPPIVDVDPEKKDPQEPVTPPVDDDKEEQQKQQKLNTAKTELTNFISDLGKNFTYSDNENNKVELDETKAKLTTNGKEEYIEETQEGNFNYYIASDNKIHRKTEETLNVDKLAKAIKNAFCDIEWDSLDGKTLKGKKDLVTISCTLDNDAINFVSLNNTFTIDKKGETEVEIPVEYIDDNFKIEENIDTLLEKLANPIQYFKYFDGNPVFTQIHRIYLKRGASGIVDTLGIVMEKDPSTTSHGLYFGEVVIDGVTEDLTYENICKNGIPKFEAYKNHQRKDICSMLSSDSDVSTYTPSINILFSGLFEEQGVRDNSEWWGYKIGLGVAQDGHTLYLFKDNKIYEKTITVYHKAELGVVNQSVEENFKGKEQSDTTWRLREDKFYQVPENSLDIYAWQKQQNKEIEV